jgi:transposase
MHRVKDRVVLEDKLSREAIAIVFQKSIQTIDRWLASGKLRSRSIGDVIALRVREQ